MYKWVCVCVVGMMINHGKVKITETEWIPDDYTEVCMMFQLPCPTFCRGVCGKHNMLIVQYNDINQCQLYSIIID